MTHRRRRFPTTGTVFDTVNTRLATEHVDALFNKVTKITLESIVVYVIPMDVIYVAFACENSIRGLRLSLGGEFKIHSCQSFGKDSFRLQSLK